METKTVEVQAGYELDERIGREVMGYKGENWRAYIPWEPSTNIAHAWQVVGKLTTPGVVFIVKAVYGGAACQIVDDFTEGPLVLADSAPLAICRAALVAINSPALVAQP